MSVKFDDFLQEQLQDPELKKEYEALQPEHAIIQAIIDARQKSGLTQKELSERTGIAQGDISKLERGNANPSIRTLQRLAAGMGMRLRLEFIPDPMTLPIALITIRARKTIPTFLRILFISVLPRMISLSPIYHRTGAYLFYSYRGWIYIACPEFLSVKDPSL